MLLVGEAKRPKPASSPQASAWTTAEIPAYSPLPTVALALRTNTEAIGTPSASDLRQVRETAVLETALMKLLGAIGTSSLFLLLGTTAAAYAPLERQEPGDKPEKQEEKAKPEKQEEKAKPMKEEAKPAKQEQEKPVKQEAKPAKQEQEKPAKQETKQAKQEQEKPAKQEAKQVKQEQDKSTKQEAKQEQEKPAKQEAKQVKQEQDKSTKQEAKQVKQEQNDNHAQQQGQQSAQQSQRDAGNKGGGEHGRISDDHYRASFGSGHNFHVNRGDYDHHRFHYGGYSFGFIDPWPVAWYYTDDVYVVYDDGGYYMYDVVHPGIRISISIL